MAAAVAPASRSWALKPPISWWRRMTGGSRSLIICAARLGQGTGQLLELAVLVAAGRAVLVIPGVRLGGRHAEGGPDDDDEVGR